MEIEAKLKLSPEALRALEARLGAPESVERQEDRYFRTPDGTALRVRREGERAFVTLKRAFSNVDGLRAREEYEPGVEPSETGLWETIFEALGFPKGLVVSKRRATYRPEPGLVVAIDHVDELGDFVEVEILADDAATALARLGEALGRLGLAELPRESRSYRELLAEKPGGAEARARNG